MINPTRVLGIVRRQAYLLRGSPVRIVPAVLWVAVDVLMWGYLSRYLVSLSAEPSPINATPLEGTVGQVAITFLGAVIFWDLLIRIMHAINSVFLEDVWSKNFVNVFSSPLTVIEYLLGLVIAGAATSVIGGVAMLFIAWVAFGYTVVGLGIGAIPFVLSLALFGIALAIGANALVLRLGPASEWVVWPIPAAIAPFVGVFYPVSILPPGLELVSTILPPTYVFEGLRELMKTGQFSLSLAGMAIAQSVGYLVLSIGIFKLTFAHVLRTGLLVRYSAESIH